MKIRFLHLIFLFASLLSAVRAKNRPEDEGQESATPLKKLNEVSGVNKEDTASINNNKGSFNSPRQSSQHCKTKPTKDDRRRCHKRLRSQRASRMKKRLVLVGEKYDRVAKNPKAAEMRQKMERLGQTMTHLTKKLQEIGKKKKVGGKERKKGKQKTDQTPKNAKRKQQETRGPIKKKPRQEQAESKPDEKKSGKKLDKKKKRAKKNGQKKTPSKKRADKKKVGKQNGQKKKE